MDEHGIAVLWAVISLLVTIWMMGALYDVSKIDRRKHLRDMGIDVSRYIGRVRRIFWVSTVVWLVLVTLLVGGIL